MNLANSPTTDQLAQLLATADDTAGHHQIWVDHDGNVNLHTFNGPPPAFLHDGSRVRFRWETFCRGNRYVGPEAANDPDWVSKLLGWLVKVWNDGRRGLVDFA